MPNIMKTGNALRNLATTFSAIRGEDFFFNVGGHLAKMLDVDYVYIGELTESKDKINVVGGCAKRKVMKLPFEYDLADTPCENVVGQSFCIYPSGVQDQFPKNTLLVEMGAESYIGAPLFSKSGCPLGLIVVLDSKPVENPEVAESLLKIFSSLVSAEIERKQTKDTLVKSETNYHLLVDYSSDPICIYSDGKWVCVNTAGIRLLGGSRPEDILNKPIIDFIHPDYHGMLMERIRHQFKEDHSPQLIEEKLLKLDGTVIEAEVTGMPITYEGKHASMVIFHDIAHHE